MKRAKMKAMKAWALVWNDGDMYGDHTDLCKTKWRAKAMLRAHGKSVCSNGEFVERIARVRISEVSK